MWVGCKYQNVIIVLKQKDWQRKNVSDLSSTQRAWLYIRNIEYANLLSREKLLFICPFLHVIICPNILSLNVKELQSNSIQADEVFRHKFDSEILISVTINVTYSPINIILLKSFSLRGINNMELVSEPSKRSSYTQGASLGLQASVPILILLCCTWHKAS